MAITTLDGIVAGAQPPVEFMKTSFTPEASNIWFSTFYTAGVPGAAVAPTPGLTGAALTTYGGQVPYSNPVSGNGYLSRAAFGVTASGCVRLMDRLWHNSGLTVTTTTAQTINSVTWPARDTNGSTDGVGVGVAIEVSTATTNAAVITNMTMSYTNSANVAGRTATLDSFNTTSTVGALYFFRLQAGDVGVRSIQSLTLGTSLLTGVVHLVAYRQLAFIPLNASVSTANDLNAITGGFPRLFDNTVPWVGYLPSAAGSQSIFGQISYAHG